MEKASEDASEAPPQPPVQHSTVDDPAPAPIVDGIGELDAEFHASVKSPNSSRSNGVDVNGNGLGVTHEHGADRDTPVGAAGSGAENEGGASTESAQLYEVSASDLTAFSELISRFEARIDKAATGRKYKGLRTSWDDALTEIGRYPDRVDLIKVAEHIVDALRTGCESARVAVVDACLDCIHRLFEYGHLGAAGESTDVVLDERDGTLDEIVGVVCGCLEVKEEEVYLRMVQTLLTAATSTRSGLHHGTLLAAVRTIYNIYLNARMPGTRTTARVSLTQILNLVFARMEAETSEDSARMHMRTEDQADTNELARGSSGEGQPTLSSTLYKGHSANADEGPDPGSDFATVLQKDAYLLFRALCKLSAKEITEDASLESVGVRSKLLSLELLRGLVSGSGPAFRSGERFIYALRHYLAPSLLSNCMSNVMQVVDVSIDIFEMLLRKETLRPLLKTEIGALFDTVVFRFLESPSAGPGRKRRALGVLNRLATDRQTLADLFLNYDCDMESSKVFERLVSILSTCAESQPPVSHSQTTSSENSMSQTQAEEFRMSALSSIIHVVTSLRDWSKPLEGAKGDAGKSPSVSTSAVTEVEVLGVAGATAESIAKDQLESPNHVKPDAGRSSEGVNGSPQSLETSGADPTPGWERSPSASSRSMAAGGGVLGTVSEGSDSDTSRFEKTLRAKKAYEEGLLEFNRKPKKGIERLIGSGRLEREPAAVAKFLFETSNLDATMVGEYLGEGDAFAVSVMHSYTDLVDMRMMSFDGALRQYLSGFRLPGESQKIDRIMEKFASRYCECNPGVFANAEAAFVLSYSTIMLHTDAHNAMIKKKMTKEEFVRNNRGINDGGDLPYDFLSNLYDRTTTTEIKLSGSVKDSTQDGAAGALGGSVSDAILDPAERAKRFKTESDELMSQTKILFSNRRKATEDYTYFSASNVYHARLMFEATWCPVLATLSLLLENASSSDSNIVALCLEGFRNSIAIASTFSMMTTKDAFISSLAKFTHLNSVSEMRAKNVECVRMILAIAAMEGSNLGEHWEVIVRAVSQVEQIRAVAAGNPTKYFLQKAPLGATSSSGPAGAPAPGTTSSGAVPGALSNGGASPSRKSAGGGASGGASYALSTSLGAKPRTGISNPGPGSTGATGHGAIGGAAGANGVQGAVMDIDSKAATVASLIDEGEIERIFINSSQLTASGVADFCSALCSVALEELGEAPVPRLFCVQKIVEMAYYNMESRTRIQWGRIWEHMGPFFATAMCHDNRDVAMYAIDALRQLASKFLEKDELSNFSFQRAFLKPFETCFGRSKVVPVRELVLTCVSQIVLARASNIKSGWKAVFAVLALAADDKNESIMNMGFQIVESIVQKYFGEIDDVFVDAVNGVSAYARSQLSSSFALRAIELLATKCASTLADGHAMSAARPIDENGEQIPAEVLRDAREELRQATDALVKKRLVESTGTFTADVDAHIAAWFPILTGLANAMQDDRPNIRAAATEGLYKALATHAGRFAPSLWVLVFRGVLSPVFDDVRHLSSSSDRAEAAAVTEWASSTGASALRSLVDVFVEHMRVSKTLLPDLLELIRGWVVQDNETVAREGMTVMSRLIKTGGDGFGADEWALIVKAMQKLFRETMPHEILGPDHQRDSGPAPDAEDAQSDGPGPGRGAEITSSTDADTVAAGSTESSGTGASTKDKQIDFKVVRSKCVVQLLLIQLVQDAVVSFYRDLTTSHILQLAATVEDSYSFAHDFNADIELRRSLYLTGFMNQIPNLLKQETTGLTVYLRIVFWLYLDANKDSDVETERKLIGLCSRVLKTFMRACDVMREKPEERREVVALIPVVVFIVNGIMQMSNEQFARHLPDMYELFLGLAEGCDDVAVRRTVMGLFRERIGPLLRAGEDDAGIGRQFVPEPQVPGKMRTLVFRVDGAVGSDTTANDVQTTLMKVSGVRSVFVDTADGTARVFTCAPDELVLAAFTTIGKAGGVTRIIEQ